MCLIFPKTTPHLRASSQRNKLVKVYMHLCSLSLSLSVLEVGGGEDSLKARISNIKIVVIIQKTGQDHLKYAHVYIHKKRKPLYICINICNVCVCVCKPTSPSKTQKFLVRLAQRGPKKAAIKLCNKHVTCLVIKVINFHTHIHMV